MRRVVIATDGDGRSYVERDDVVEPGARTTREGDGTGTAAVRVAHLWTQEGPPPPVAAARTGHAATHLDLPIGGHRWTVVVMPPEVEYAPHWTETLDYQYVLEGELDVVVDTGPVRLRAGDTVVMLGAPHGWRTTTSGATLLGVMNGTLGNTPA